MIDLDLYLKSECTIMFDKTVVRSERVCGFCRSNTHKGYINYRLYKKHGCATKQDNKICPKFVELNEQFWKSIRNQTSNSKCNVNKRKRLSRKELNAMYEKMKARADLN